MDHVTHKFVGTPARSAVGINSPVICIRQRQQCLAQSLCTKRPGPAGTPKPARDWRPAWASCQFRMRANHQHGGVGPTDSLTKGLPALRVAHRSFARLVHGRGPRWSESLGTAVRDVDTDRRPDIASEGRGSRIVDLGTMRGILRSSCWFSRHFALPWSARLQRRPHSIDPRSSSRDPFCSAITSIGYQVL